MKSVLKATTKLLFCKLCDRMSVEYLIKSNPLNPVPRPELNPALDGIRDHLGSVIVFVNPKSGGKKGEIVLAILKNYLPKENVFDLTKRGPKEGLEMHKEKKDLKIIACGGDGTAGWVLSAMDEIDFGGDPPAIAMIPLGTGNDLARSFGWGGGYIVDEEPMKDFLDKVINGSVIKMDRWSIATTRRSESNRKEADKSTRDKSTLPYSSLNNYLSIGADSKIALDFHRARDKNPEHFTSQSLNKVEYAKNYNKELIMRSCKNVVDHIKVLECDGVDCLPILKKNKSESIVVLNIRYYMGGTKPWKNGEIGFTRQNFSDKKLEIVGFKTADMIGLQLGGHGDNIAQGSKIRIVTDAILPMKVDGEPVNLVPSEIIIEHKNQVNFVHGALC